MLPEGPPGGVYTAGMAYPTPRAAHRRTYREHGWLALPDALPADDLAALRARCERVKTDPSLSYDATAMAGQEPPEGHQPVLMSMLPLVWLEWQQQRFHTWTHAMAEALAGEPVSFWYDQLLVKPPGGAPTWWHQDEAYLGVEDDDLLVSCWLTLDDVGVEGGCMHFEDRGHRRGIVRELLTREYGGSRWQPTNEVVACPLPAGGVTFHHGKMPHMTFGNTTDTWRIAVIQRFTLDRVPRPTGHATGFADD